MGKITWMYYLGVEIFLEFEIVTWKMCPGITCSGWDCLWQLDLPRWLDLPGIAEFGLGVYDVVAPRVLVLPPGRTGAF